MSTKRELLPIGSISHGTMRDADLIPDFFYAVEHLNNPSARRAARSIRTEYADVFALADSEDWEIARETFGEDCSWLLEQLFNTLNDFCPDFTHFGAHEGDGSDYGVWIDFLPCGARYSGSFHPGA